jgi:hypothetical protein
MVAELRKQCNWRVAPTGPRSIHNRRVVFDGAVLDRLRRLGLVEKRDGVWCTTEEGSRLLASQP